MHIMIYYFKHRLWNNYNTEILIESYHLAQFKNKYVLGNLHNNLK